MNRVFAAFLSLGLATVSAAQQPPNDNSATDRPTAVVTSSNGPKELTDAMEILKRADQALKRVDLVSYRGVFKSTGWMARRSPTVSGTVIVSGKDPESPKKYRLAVDVRLATGESYKDLIIASDSRLHYLIDPEAKTAYVGCGRSMTGPRGVTSMAIALPHFTHPNALLDEMSMDLATLIGSATIGGVDCYEIQLQNATDMGEILWWFSKKDFLPRRRQIVLVNTKFQEATMDLVLTELQVDPKFDKDPFGFVLPEGYTRKDEPAP